MAIIPSAVMVMSLAAGRTGGIVDEASCTGRANCAEIRSAPLRPRKVTPASVKIQ
jgi:hypothetical protein